MRAMTLSFLGDPSGAAQVLREASRGEIGDLRGRREVGRERRIALPLRA
jgi:hypothetical protein